MALVSGIPEAFAFWLKVLVGKTAWVRVPLSSNSVLFAGFDDYVPKLFAPGVVPEEPRYFCRGTKGEWDGGS